MNKKTKGKHQGIKLIVLIKLKQKLNSLIGLRINLFIVFFSVAKFLPLVSFL